MKTPFTGFQLGQHSVPGFTMLYMRAPVLAAILPAMEIIAGKPIWSAGGCGVSHIEGYHFVLTSNGPRCYPVQVPQPYK